MFKDKLKNLRKSKNLSQQELANIIYVSRSAICKWEMGNGIPSDANIEALCEYFDVTKEWLFDLQDIKEGEIITKRNKFVNCSNIILIILTFIFLVIVLTTLSTRNSIINIKVLVNLWRLFNVYELIIFIGGLAISFGIGLLLIFNNNGFLTLNVDDIKRKKILNFGYVISIVLFIIFLIYTVRRLGDPNSYKSFGSMNVILEDSILTCGVGLIVLSYTLSEKAVKTLDVIFSIINFVILFLAIGVFILTTKLYNDNNIVGIIVCFIINCICSLICLIISIVSIASNKKSRNKILNLINIATIIVCVIMFIIYITIFL